MIGKTISHYKITEKLGEGGMGEVYLADDIKLDRPVALKFLPQHLTSNEELKKRFIHEAKAASALQHNNICTIHDIDETEDGQSFIVMDCYDGESLKLKIEKGRLKIEEAIDYTIQIAQGLQKAHEKGIIHRDIKPANIMITEDGVTKIVDFGLAKLSKYTNLTKDGASVGTIAYMSPEQTKGVEVDHRSDIWSLGVVLYEMITGDLPFKGDYDQAVVYSILNEKPDSIENIPLEIKDIIETALAKNPDERYQNIEQLITDLKVVKGDSDSSHNRESQRGNLKGKGIGKFIIYPVILAVVLLAGYFTIQTLIEKEIKPVPIAVISFENLTGDPAYDDLRKVIPNLLITDLEQSKFFHVNTWERMRDLLEQAGEENREYIDVEVGINLAKMDNIPAIITGSVAKIGEMFSIDVKILDTDTKEIIKSAKSVGKGENSILEHQVDDLSEQIATAIDLPEKEFVKTKIPIIDVTTTSLEAYKYYLLGREDIEAYQIKKARENFSKAVLLDSTFAMAHSYLAIIFWSFENNEQRNTHLDMANRYRDKVTHKEKMIIDWHYTWAKGHDKSKIINDLKKATSLYPKDKQIYLILGSCYSFSAEHDSAIVFYKKALDLDPNLKDALNFIGYEYAEKKDYSKALEYFQRYLDIAPNEPNPYDSMGEVYLEMNEYEKSIEMYQEALEIKPDFYSSHFPIVQVYVKMGEYKKARTQLNQYSAFASSYSDRRRIHYLMAATYMGEGDFENTLKELEDRGKLAKQNSYSWQIALNLLNRSEILFENGKIKEAEEKLAESGRFIENLEWSEENKNSLMIMYLSNSTRLALKKGDINQAKEYAEMYKKDAESKNHPQNLKWCFTHSGLIAYAEGNYEKAITDLRQSDMNIPFNNYHLALAYIKIGDEKNAIKKFKSVANYSGRVRIRHEMVRGCAKKQLEKK